jgi:ribosomal protein S27E
MDEEIEFVECPECGYEQADMGANVACEECGELMPTNQKGDF